MAVHTTATSATPATHPHTTYRVTEAVLGIVGAIAAFVGTFILVGGEDQYVGLGGEASWAVGDIAPAWGYGLLIGGVVAVLAALALAVRDHRHPAEGHGTQSGWGDVIAHSIAFVLVNAFLWIQDIAIGGGVDYAYWVTIPWGIGLAAHIVSVGRAERRSAQPG
jgi:hypothetical protein